MRLIVFFSKENEPTNGLRFYTRSSVEYYILGIRGRLERMSKAIQQLVETEEPEYFRGPVKRHSEKPLEIRTRIEQLYGEKPRIEIFSRHVIPGWDRIGNEIL